MFTQSFKNLKALKGASIVKNIKMFLERDCKITGLVSKKKKEGGKNYLVGRQESWLCSYLVFGLNKESREKRVRKEFKSRF